MAHDTFDAHLDDWQTLHSRQPAQSLLLGNGASRAVWRSFAYDGLFERAQKVRNKPLSLTDLALFKSLQTRSFEQVLAVLNSTIRVNAALAISSTAPLNRYYAIKEALIHAVRSVHIPFRLLDEQRLAALNLALRAFDTVYSSNYDLLCPWAVQHDTQGFAELMDVDTGFDIRHTASTGCRVLYLHGGLHLIKNSDGTTRQRTAEGEALLDGFAINTPGDVPLLVNEGPSAQKLRTIRDSDYLSWCHGELSRQDGTLCIFGHNLDSDDAHILQALRLAPAQTLYVSIFPLSDAWIISQKQRFEELFAGCGKTLYFFDATSHGLGSAQLNVAVPAVLKKKR
ncbi:DUF4917 family protein [Pseudomonas sp. CFBP 13727]|uniref:DUF4917 family protein n=1 Tax=Pseudomonas sp. CFBP 13727 TaxID=2775295 RepID=UPI00177C5CAE|nr:DUF4917 family protein [Pseudomonas sp. CFBP 13727]MBD8622425.1 DUF4917 family protein [Pseudomonas sp. CFBP 13727]